MGKYNPKNEKVLDPLIYIANELAEANRLKRLDLKRQQYEYYMDLKDEA